MSLFDKEFYPTPREIIIKMLAPYAERLGSARILEPSAGNGAILDVLAKGLPYDFTARNGEVIECTAKAGKMYCIEKDPELRLILQQKGYRLLADDFLAFTPEHHFDLIAMNPPFHSGAEHLLHAWEILRSGDIVCLLNAETLRNPCTAKRRQLAAIIAEHGSTEELGRCFAGSDHDTDVEVTMVRLHKDAPQQREFLFDAGAFAQETAPDFGSLSASGNQVAVNDALDAYLRVWEMAKRGAVEFIKSFQAFAFFADTFLRKDTNVNDGKEYVSLYHMMMRDLTHDKNEHGAENAYDNFIDAAKEKAWNQIITQLGLDRYMTSAMKDTMQQFRAAQGSFELSKPNIMALFQMIMGNLGNIMNKCVSDVYDIFTRFYAGNTSCEEGWKTNKRYRANRKIILPNVADAGFMPQRYGYNKKFSVDSFAWQRLDDIDKAMCWLSGTQFDAIKDNTISSVIREINVGDQEWHPSAFFDVKCFKKGTVHLQFRDEDLLNKFNITVNEGKNQLGAGENA